MRALLLLLLLLGSIARESDARMRRLHVEDNVRLSLSLPLLLSLPPRSGPAPRDVVVRGQDLAEMHDLGGAWQGGKLEEEGGELGEQAPRRTEWPELLGADAGRAREAILRDQPDLRVDIVRQPEDANAGDQANKVQPDARVRPTRAVARHDAPIVSARTHMPATSRHTCMRVSYERVETRTTIPRTLTQTRTGVDLCG